MAKAIHIMPEIIGEEMLFNDSIVRDMEDDVAQQFANIYRARRKDPQLILMLTLVGFLGFAGIQRFFVDQIGMGILYLFTGGLCMIGTIVDLVNYKRISFEFNQREAQQIAALIRN